MITQTPKIPVRRVRRRSVVAASILRGGCRLAPILGMFGICVLLSAGTARAAVNIEVQIHDFAFEPPSLSVAIGSEVTWVNHDEELHLVVDPVGGFKSEPLDTGDRFSFRFDKPGIYEYFCSLHPHMIGRIIVGQGIEGTNDGSKDRAKASEQANVK